MDGMTRLARIVRHPIKSVGFEDLEAVVLTPDRALPFDRVWAILHEAGEIAPGAWAPKRNFLRGVAAPGLMAISARLAPGGHVVGLSHPEAGSLEVDLDDPAGGARLIEWLLPLWPENRPAPARVVSRPEAHLADNPDPWVSVLNLASLRALERRMGRALSIHRFRGNLWLEGLAEWKEFDLVGRTFRIGAVELRVEQRITRCEATSVDPATGRRDGDTLAALEAGWGHRDFGVFARVLTGGTLTPGAAAVLP